jgi:glycyl-tRNA synthetase (class II)
LERRASEVAIRERDSMDQVRVPISGLVEALRERLAGA